MAPMSLIDYSLVLRQAAKTLDLRQIRLLRQIEHPSVCRVYEIAEVDGQAPGAVKCRQGEKPARIVIPRSSR